MGGGNMRSPSKGEAGQRWLPGQLHFPPPGGAESTVTHKSLVAWLNIQSLFHFLASRTVFTCETDVWLGWGDDDDKNHCLLHSE